MKILFDNIIFARQKCGGISVVWYELIRRFIRDEYDMHFIDFQPNNNILRNKLEIPDRLLSITNSKYRKIYKYLPVRHRCGEQFIFHSSYYRVCMNKHAINVTTVHDFTNELFQKGLGALKDRWIKHHAIRHSDYIICISENTKKDFQKFFPSFPEERIRVIYNGVSDKYHPIDGQQEPICPLPPHSFLLFVGERFGYKNFNLVVETLQRYEADLVIVGNELSAIETESLKTIKGTYYYAGRVGNSTLNRYYNQALALIYPSSYEGFGLPVIEAQRAGCPVIAYNASSIPEVIGDTPLLMKELTPVELISKIEMLSREDILQETIKKGKRNAERFDWEKTYEQTSSFYTSIFLSATPRL